MNFTPPSPMKATPATIASNSYDVSTALGSDADDVTMTSPSQKGELLNTNSILPNQDPPKGKTTTIIAVMRGEPKVKMVTTANAVTSTSNKKYCGSC